MRGSVYPRKEDGRWVGAVDMGKDEYGKRQRETMYANSKEEAEDKVNDLIYEINHGLYTKKTKDNLSAFLNDYISIKEDQWEETTASLYKMYVRVHFEPYFKDKRLESINAVDIEKFYNFKSKTLSSNTIIKLHKFLNSAYSYGVQKDKIKINMCAKATPPKFKKYNPNVYDEKQFLILWNNLESKRDRVMISLGAGAGFRRGEIAGLKWNNVDFVNKSLTVEKTMVRFDKTIEKKPKTDESARTIYVPDYVINELESYKKELKVIKIDNRVLGITPQYCSERFKKILKDFNLPPTRLHDLRHYNAVLMMTLGIPDKIAASRLGHSQVSTLREVYQHTQDNIDREASKKLNDLFNKKTV